MFRTIQLLLPALIPSWRFFHSIGPSPRIEILRLHTEEDSPDDWQEFRPRPAYLSFTTMLKRIFWNPDWNETLFLMSCAERLIQNPTQHSLDEIERHLRNDLEPTDKDYFQFRLVFISREDDNLQNHVIFTSPVYPYAKENVS